jgi:UDP-4-amino-4,6-dideoxy-N-acetyl-beta-L-altrosamine transaminase
MIIPYSRQSINLQDLNAVKKILKSKYLTQGPAVELFEDEVAKKCNSKFATSFNSATSALHVSLLALGIKKNDIVWTSPITFVATSNAALYCGAKVDFVDINPLSVNICIKNLKAKLILAKKTNQLPKLIIVVHMAGNSCEMDEIFKLSNKFKFKIIEDASHAIGGSFKSAKIGCCKYSDITVFSFHPVKIITTGEGGMALTNSKKINSMMTLLRSHGITKKPIDFKMKSDGLWYYEQQILGFNYRMTDIQAALGLSQLKRLEYFIKIRNNLALRYDKLLKDLPLILPYRDSKSLSSMHLYIVLVDKKRTSRTRKELFDYLISHGIGVNVHYIPVHLQPFYRKLGFKKGMYPNAEEYYKNALSLPLFPDLSISLQMKIVKHLRIFFD